MAPPRGRGRTVSAPAGRGAPPSTSGYGGSPPESGGPHQGSTDSYSVDSRRCFEISPEGRLLEPSGLASTIVDCFKKINNPTGFTWKLTPPEIKEQYFEEFKKHFRWPADWDQAVHHMWQKRASKRFSDWHYEMKMGRPKKPDYINTERWAALNEYWMRPEVLQKSETASQCRRSEPEPGAGMSKHKGGSRSAMQYSQSTASQRGCSLESTAFDTFQSLHYKGGDFSNMKAARLHAEVERIAAEEGPHADKNAIYLRLEGVRDKKQRLYGFGEEGSGYINAASRSSTSSLGPSQSNAEIMRRLEEESAARRSLEAQVAYMNAQMTQLMEMMGSSSRRQPPDDSADQSPPPTSL